MRKPFVVVLSVIVALGLVAYAKGGVRANTTRCFLDVTKEHQEANPGKVQYLRDIPALFPKIAVCAESKNSLLESLFFDSAKIGDYIRISKPTAAESKNYDADK